MSTVIELTEAPDPARCCEQLAGLPYRLFLDSATPGTRLGRYSFLTADPVAVVQSKGGGTDVLAQVGELLRPHRRDPLDGLPPFQGGAAGYFAYDWGRVLERLPESRYDDLGLPDAVLGIYDWVIAWDHRSSRAWLISTGMPVTDDAARSRRAEERAKQVMERLRAEAPRQGAPYEAVVGHNVVVGHPFKGAEAAPSYPVEGGWWDRGLDVRSSFTHAGYLDAVRRVREYILAGDIFQTNLSQRFEVPLTESPWDLYRRMRIRNAAPFAAFFETPDVSVVSASPERFLRVDERGHVETRPIKGTMPRGFGPEHDGALGQALSESAKDRAENLMIVDLMRNDLSRVCSPGTVRVPELFALEHYATVHHLVSTVVGDLAPGSDALDLLRAAFPGGSITGAPKVRAMEIIAELEPSQRSVYCGSIGYGSVTGALDTSIAIRTVIAPAGRDRVYFGAGGGIVADSDPELEYRETLHKARGMIDALRSMILLIDNYDSFVHNLARYVRELGWEAMVRRNDAITVDDVERLAPSHIIISPGPRTPAEAGISTEIVRRLGPTTPILGVCLGHQCIGAAYGGPIVRAVRPVHGKTSAIVHDGTSIFTGLPSPIRVARYHSLVIGRPDVPPSLRVLATARDDHEVMAVEHREYPVVGVQFHPESAATEYGYAMLDRFLRGDRARLADVAARADGAPGTPPPVEDEPRTFVPPSVEHVR